MRNININLSSIAKKAVGGGLFKLNKPKCLLAKTLINTSSNGGTK